VNVRRVDIDEGGIVGSVFEPGDTRGFVVVLSGSGGGVPSGYAQRLAENGLCAFALAYFGAPGLPRALVEVPIESVERGIDFFRDRYTDGRAVGLLGSSKGAELALVVASFLPASVGTVVAVDPSAVVWYGLDQMDRSSGMRSSWTWRGAPLAFLPFRADVQPIAGPEGLRVDLCYDLSLYDDGAIDAATIEVERCNGPLLLLSGADDHMGPSSSFAERIVERMAARGRGAAVTSVVYPGAGHAFLHREFFANRDRSGRPIWDFGGDVESDARAAADAWPRLIAFLADNRS
jgi:dienelactone hydrolase